MKKAMEINFPEELRKILSLPTLHILLERKPGGILAGQCLDFDIWAYSEQEDDSDAEIHVVIRLIEMAIIDCVSLFEKNLLGELYANIEVSSERWTEYGTLMNSARISALQKSLENILENPDSLRNLETKQFNFNHFSEMEINQVNHWLSELQSANPEKRAAILMSMVRSLKEIIPLRLLAKAS